MLDQINEDILAMPDERRELVSDGYHTFKKLYEHRIVLFVALCNSLAYQYPNDNLLWKSKLHSDGTMFDGWFIAGIGNEKGKTLTYHLPNSEWDNINCIEIPNAPEWDGHTSEDVLKLLREIK